MNFLPKLIVLLRGYIVGLSMTLLAAGCAPESKEMVANNVPYVTASRDSVIVIVSGGGELTLLNRALIPDRSFSTALIDSLRRAGMFRSVQGSGSADYKLEARIENFSQATGISSATFGLKVDWLLTRAPDRVVWRTQTRATFSGPLRPTFVDLEHLRMASEKAARENIERALAELAQINF